MKLIALAVAGVLAAAGTASAARIETVRVVEGKPLEFSISLSPGFVRAGRVLFLIRNEGRIPHDLAARGKVSRRLAPGASCRLVVRFPVRGVYTLRSDILGQAQAGMTTYFTVLGP
jgi:uncharacterized cupredoxin-like copper-binding protein